MDVWHQIIKHDSNKISALFSVKYWTGLDETGRRAFFCAGCGTTGGHDTCLSRLCWWWLHAVFLWFGTWKRSWEQQMLQTNRYPGSWTPDCWKSLEPVCGSSGDLLCSAMLRHSAVNLPRCFLCLYQVNLSRVSHRFSRLQARLFALHWFPFLHSLSLLLWRSFNHRHYHRQSLCPWALLVTRPRNPQNF